MNTLGFVLLSLLAREPMSGYDLTVKLKWKKKFIPFWPISHTQIYPALAKLEEQGLVRHRLVEQRAVRPDKKVYEITKEGRIALKQWVESPTPLGVARDEFFLKAYSLWLADPERMKEVFREQMRLHEDQLAQYEETRKAKQSSATTLLPSDESFELRELAVQYMIGYEQNYIAWCQSVLRYLEQQKHNHKEAQ